MGRPGAGALTILVGGPALRDHAEGGTYLDLGAIPRDRDRHHVLGAASYDRFGIWMRAGDVDGDGIDDIVVGADEVDATRRDAEPRRGRTSSAAALTSTPIRSSTSPTSGRWTFRTRSQATWRKLEPPAGSNKYHLGATCQIGDLDGDGKGEVIARRA